MKKFDLNIEKVLEDQELGEYHDELTWIDLSVHACKLLKYKIQSSF